MTVQSTHISWTDSSWNPTVGCDKVGPECDNCYAELIANRLMGGFHLRLHPDRLAQAARFRPIATAAGPRPRMVFVNSMSDLFHPDIPVAFLDRVFEGMEANPAAVFQILTKRAPGMRRYIVGRYAATGVPDHIWLGVSTGHDPSRGRLDQLRRLKDAVGEFCAFVSVEPLIGAVEKHDYRGLDWVLIGGESGPKARPMDIDWARHSRDAAAQASAAIWFKQFGTWPNNPLYRAAPDALPHIVRVHHAIMHGEHEARIVTGRGGRHKVVGEKGGATLDGEVLHGRPAAYARLTERLRAPKGQMALV